MNTRLLLVDGHSYAYRAFFAIRTLTSPGGRPVNAVYGFIKMMEKIVSLLTPTHLSVIWDGGLSDSRTKVLPGYKAQRESMPEDLREQIGQIQEYLEASGYCTICREGEEADDIIGSVATKMAAQGHVIHIASPDKDFMQLVSEKVSLLNAGDKTGELWNADRVVEKTGVKPAQIVDWLSLIGDSSDNIPGVPGVGPKTATLLLGKFGSIDGIYSNLEAIESEKLRASLIASSEVVHRNRGLIKLLDGLAADYDMARFVPHKADILRLRELYQKWGFKSLLAQLPLEAPTQGCLL